MTGADQSLARCNGGFSDIQILPVICPTCQQISEKPQMPCRHPLATVHGVVFDILGARPAYARRLACRVGARGRARPGPKSPSKSASVSASTSLASRLAYSRAHRAAEQKTCVGCCRTVSHSRSSSSGLTGRSSRAAGAARSLPVIPRSPCDEAIQSSFVAFWIASLALATT